MSLGLCMCWNRMNQGSNKTRRLFWRCEQYMQVATPLRVAGGWVVRGGLPT